MRVKLLHESNRAEASLRGTTSRGGWGIRRIRGGRGGRGRSRRTAVNRVAAVDRVSAAYRDATGTAARRGRARIADGLTSRRTSVRHAAAAVAMPTEQTAAGTTTTMVAAEQAAATTTAVMATTKQTAATTGIAGRNACAAVATKTGHSLLLATQQRETDDRHERGNPKQDSAIHRRLLHKPKFLYLANNTVK